jgi:hypothetical protein
MFVKWGALLRVSISMVVPESKNLSVSMEIRVHGLILNYYNVIPKRDEWIRPAPRDSGLRQKRQCGVPSSCQERLKHIYSTFLRLIS